MTAVGHDCPSSIELCRVSDYLCKSAIQCWTHDLYGNNLSLDSYCFTHGKGHAICMMRANHATDNIALMGVNSMTQRVPLVLHGMRAT